MIILRSYKSNSICGNWRMALTPKLIGNLFFLRNTIPIRHFYWFCNRVMCMQNNRETTCWYKCNGRYWPSLLATQTTTNLPKTNMIIWFYGLRFYDALLRIVLYCVCLNSKTKEKSNPEPVNDWMKSSYECFYIKLHMKYST